MIECHIRVSHFMQMFINEQARYEPYIKGQMSEYVRTSRQTTKTNASAKGKIGCI